MGFFSGVGPEAAWTEFEIFEVFVLAGERPQFFAYVDRQSLATFSLRATLP